MGQEIGQRLGLATARTQMRVGDEDRAVITARPERLPRYGASTLGEDAFGPLEPDSAAAERRVENRPCHLWSPAFVRVRRICAPAGEVADPRESFVASERR